MATWPRAFVQHLAQRNIAPRATHAQLPEPQGSPLTPTLVQLPVCRRPADMQQPCPAIATAYTVTCTLDGISTSSARPLTSRDSHERATALPLGPATSTMPNGRPPSGGPPTRKIRATGPKQHCRYSSSPTYFVGLCHAHAMPLEPHFPTNRTAHSRGLPPSQPQPGAPDGLPAPAAAAGARSTPTHCPYMPLHACAHSLHCNLHLLAPGPRGLATPGKAPKPRHSSTITHGIVTP